MAKDPAFLLYSQDFFVGCVGMTDEEVGRYMRIICIMHQKGRLSESVVKQFGEITPILKEKFLIDEQGLWYNERLEAEAEKRRNYSESRRKNRESKQDNSKNQTYDKHMASHMEDENENENTLIKKESKKISKDEELEVFADKWNKLAQDYNFKQVSELSKARKTNLTKRLSEKNFDFDRILLEIRGSPLLQGADPKFDFKPTFDWVIDDKQNYLKIMEGNYKSNKYITLFTTWRSNGTGKDSQIIEYNPNTERAKMKHLETGKVFELSKYDLEKQYKQIPIN